VIDLQAESNTISEDHQKRRGARNLVRQLYGASVLGGIWVRRQPMWIFQGLVGTLGFVMAMFAWGGGLALQNLAVAYVITGAWMQGMNIVAQSFGWAKIDHETDRVIASPLSLPIYFVGIVVGTLPFMLVELMPAFVLTLVVGISLSIFFRLLILVPVALVVGTFISLSIVLKVKNPTNISAITNPLTTLTVILPPIYYPISVLPRFVQIVSLALPPVSMMQIGRWIAGFPLTFNPLLPISIIVAWLVGISIILKKTIKWGME
jgi:ABC-2 type transport system permease protein